MRASARRKAWPAQPPEIVFAWALFARSNDGRAFRPLPVIYATRAQARADRDVDEVVRPVAVLSGRWRSALSARRYPVRR